MPPLVPQAASPNRNLLREVERLRFVHQPYDDVAVAEKIQEYVQRLLERLHGEVLDFGEYLLRKVEREEASREDRDWSAASLTQALRGMEKEEGPSYSTDDLKESFQ